MEAAPPTYEQATVVNLWSLVAPFLDSRDLLSASLVCKDWHATFSRRLWGNPASHFATADGSRRDAVKKFLEIIQTARLVVRKLTHTLLVPPINTELWVEPLVGWFRITILKLPNLQSLIVTDPSALDHNELHAFASNQEKSSTERSIALRLFDASWCRNATSRGLSYALGHLENLIYLDLSFTLPAREKDTLETLRKLSGLRVLKLRGVGLRDEDLKHLAAAVEYRVKCMDLRDNQMTDNGIQLLLDHCITSDITPMYGSSRRLLASLGTQMLDIYSGEDFADFLLKLFTRDFVKRLAIEDIQPDGITHIYVAGNFVSVEGVTKLLRSESLHVIDVGTLSPTTRASLAGTRMPSRPDLTAAEMNNLNAALEQHAGKSLTYLRIDYRAVVAVAFPTRLAQTCIPTESRVELDIQPQVSGRKFHPGFIPHVSTLTLTDIPASTSGTGTADCIIDLIKMCATQASKAKREAKEDYTIPPGRRNNESSIRQSAKEAFALQRLVLELAVTGKQTSHSSWHHRETMSVAQHNDSEVFWSAAKNDFSFFHPESEEKDTLPLFSVEKTQAVPSSPAQHASISRKTVREDRNNDTIAHISSFRKETKIAHERSTREGDLDSEVDGYWNGTVQVIR